MTEVRTKGTLDGAGLFATKDYAVGDIIIDREDVLILLAPTDAQEESLLIENLDSKPEKSKNQVQKGNKKKQKGKSTNVSTLWECIEVPKGIEDKYASKFKAMLQAALCYFHKKESLSEDQRSKLLQLYHPVEKDNHDKDQATLDEEQIVINLSQKVLDHLKEKFSPDSIVKKKVAEDSNTAFELQNIMLIWASNAFDGGRVYEQISRINHSCDPNAIVKAADDHPNKQSIIAAAPITTGEEITISYLGTLLYSDKISRQQILRRDKHFVCQCDRCVKVIDFAAAIPCLACHVRQGRQLEEDAQYDDEQTVKYAYPQPTNQETSNRSEGNDKQKPVVYLCKACNNKFSSNEKQYQKIFSVNRSVEDKVMAFMDDHDVWSKQKGVHRTGNKEDEDAEEREEQDAVHSDRLEQHLRMASSVLGAKHWTTNVMMLLQLTEILQSYHANLLAKTQGSQTDDGEEEEDPMETLAQAIDMLERICRFVDGLGLKLHRGHLLSDVIIGTARALVSLGDTKSQKYAAEWLDKISKDYVSNFEPEGIRKVVQSLQDAWKRSEEESGRAQKRAKVG